MKLILKNNECQKCNIRYGMMGLKIRSDKREEKAEHKNSECQKHNVWYGMMWLKIRSNKREEKHCFCVQLSLLSYYS